MTDLTENGMIRDIELLAAALNNLQGNIWQAVPSQGGDPTHAELTEQALTNKKAAADCLKRLGPVGGHLGSSLLRSAGIAEKQFKDCFHVAEAQLQVIARGRSNEERTTAQVLLLKQVAPLRDIITALERAKKAR